MISHPLYWFLFAFLDTETMTFRDPLFLIPSEVFFAYIKSTAKYKKTRQVAFLFHANMALHSHDMWAPYRVLCKELGPRLLQILRAAEQSPTASRLGADFTIEPGMV
ncbi:MAG TPA: hypothetical protein VFR68_12730 [Candidatus Dormibacteraeota bacterium]|nr:hypothetical protein [Candidatus Dormibacteraeota bacterium]